MLRQLQGIWQPQKALVITGLNGSGKTTLLRVLAGFLTPAAGNLAWLDADHHLIDPPSRIFSGYRAPIKPLLLVREHLTFWAGIYGTSGLATKLLADLRLESLLDRPGHMLSEGQKKRLDLSRLILSGANCWLLDEPLAGLDGQGQEMVKKLVADRLLMGGLVAIATHQPLNGVDQSILDLNQ